MCFIRYCSSFRLAVPSKLDHSYGAYFSTLPAGPTFITHIHMYRYTHRVSIYRDLIFVCFTASPQCWLRLMGIGSFLFSHLNRLSCRLGGQLLSLFYAMPIQVLGASVISHDSRDKIICYIISAVVN